MKKKFVLLSIVFSIFLLLIGCSTNKNNDTVTVQAPKNIKLKLGGIWKADSYDILDSEIVNYDYMYDVLSNKIEITNSSVTFGGRVYDGVNYKLKYVDSDYKLSYEAEKKISDLGIDNDNVEVYSVSNDNNLLCEIIYTGTKKSFLYYQGILFKINYDRKISNKDVVTSEKYSDKQDKIKKSSQALLLGLETTNSNENGEYESEKYRTLWISTKSGVLQTIKEKQDIIFPRSSGIWKLRKNIYTDKNKGIYYEYFKAQAIDSQLQNDITIGNTSQIPNGKIVKQQINYVGGDYIGTNVETNEKLSQSPVYKVLPVDNLLADKGVTVNDIYGLDINNKFEQDYRNVYAKISSQNKAKLCKDINYSNFTLVRNNGEWRLEGRISPVTSGVDAIDFPLNIDVSRILNNYTFVLPWKVLKGEIPLLTDAFTSPDGSIVVILTNNELQVYRIECGRLGKNPLIKIAIKTGEKVIMAEWCEDDYINKSASVFSDGENILG